MPGDSKPITDAELAEVEAMSMALRGTGFPLKSEVLGLIARLRSAEMERDEARFQCESFRLEGKEFAKTAASFADERDTAQAKLSEVERERDYALSKLHNYGHMLRRYRESREFEAEGDLMGSGNAWQDVIGYLDAFLALSPSGGKDSSGEDSL